MPLPTWRLFAALLVAAPFAALGGPFVLLAVAIALICVMAAAVDWRLAGDGRQVRVERSLASDKLSLGAWNPVELHITNAGARRQRLTLREQPPVGFELDRSGLTASSHPERSEGSVTSTLEARVLFKADVDAADMASLTYHVRPPRRGDATFGHLYVRVEGPLRLVKRTFRQAGTTTAVRVYPNLRELRRYDLLVRRGLEFQAAGRPVRVAGASTEFERIREYLPDDEFRRINWKATARRGQPLVNQFEAERSQNLVLLLDAGRSMAALADPPAEDDTESASIPGLTKLDRALNTALLLAYVASSRGDRVSLLAYADEVRAFIPPQRGRRALLSCVQTLYNLRAEPIEPEHARAFSFLAQRNLRRSLVVLFTDVGDRESSSALAAQLARAARQHLVVCVTLLDPNVRRPAEVHPADGRQLFEKMVAQQLLDERAAVLAELAARGVLTVDSDAEALNPKVIAAYLEAKARGRI